MSKAKCPLTGEFLDTPVATYDVKEVAAAYKDNRNVDVSGEFSGDQIELYYNSAVSFGFFVPFKSGSSDFYNRLALGRRYIDDKPEFRFASQFVGPSDTVLDVGCGFGAFRNYLSDTVSYTGTEFNSMAVEECQKKGLSVTPASLSDLKKQGSSFDLVGCFQVLEHVENPVEFFADLVSVTKPGGYLVISVPNCDGPMGDMEDSFMNFPPHHVSLWSKKSLLFLGRKFPLEAWDWDYQHAPHIGPALYHCCKSFFGANRFKLNHYNRLRLLLRKGFNGLGRVLSMRAESFAMPLGHSITIAWRKNL